MNIDKLQGLQAEYRRVMDQIAVLDGVPLNIPLVDEFFQTRAYLESRALELEIEIATLERYAYPA